VIDADFLFAVEFRAEGRVNYMGVTRQQQCGFMFRGIEVDTSHVTHQVAPREQACDSSHG
jgi:hypothetical protein